MSVRIEKVREAELQIDKLVAQEKQMRRAFLADGTVDKNEQQQLDGVDGKIAKLKSAVAKTRAEIETARRAWEARGSDFKRLQADVETLAAWGHADSAKVKAGAEKIGPPVADQDWDEARKQLDAAARVQDPAMVDYHSQVDAKTAYDPLRADTDLRLSRASAADPMTPDIDESLGSLTAQIGVVDGSLGTKDYVSALATVGAMVPVLVTLETAVTTARKQKSDYDADMASLEPRYVEAQGCVFDTLADQYRDLEERHAKIADAVGKADFVEARSVIAALDVKVGLYMADYAKVVDAQTLYTARRPRIDNDLKKVNACRFPDLTPQQQAILDEDAGMRGLAGAGSFDQALVAMDRLDPLIETFRKAEADAEKAEDYTKKRATVEPGLGPVRACKYLPLEALQSKITSTLDAADKSAATKSYTDALALLGDVETGLSDFETKFAEQQSAQAAYEAGLAAIVARFQAASTCVYPQLSKQASDLIALNDRMTAAASGGDFPAAVAAMKDLDRDLGLFEASMKEFAAKQAEYDTRRPPLIQRFDGSMVSDYVKLEDERSSLQTARADMESAAANSDFPLAVDHLNAVERMLNDLDAQAGDLTATKKQYEAVLASIEPGLASAQDCKHEELAPKRAEILKIRADMLSLGVEEDFGAALDRANSLVPLLVAFAVLEAQVEEYRRRLEVIQPRLETVRAFTYKSLKERQDKIAALFASMTAQAAKAELTDALKQMGELEALVTEIIKLNDDLKTQEPVYKKLHDDLAPKIKMIQDSKIEKAEVKTAATIATGSWEKLEELGGKDEFIEAVKQADNVAADVEAFRTAVDNYGDAKEAFELLRKMADSGFEEASKKAGEYEDLEPDLDTLVKLHSAMTDAGKGDSPDYDDAKAKAQKLLDALGEFDGKWREATNREAAVNAAAEAANRRFVALPKDAAEKAEDDYDDAKDARGELQKALDAKKLERAEEKVKELNAALDRLEGALKTTAERKAEYDTRLAPLQKQVGDANASPFLGGLSKELDAVNSALKDMTGRGEAEDYEGGVKAADKVDEALSAFNTAEDKLEQMKAVLVERIGEIEKDMPKLDDIHNLGLISQVVSIRTNEKVMQSQFKVMDLVNADKTSTRVRDDLRKLLDEAEKLEDDSVKAEDDKGIAERARDLTEDIAEKVWDAAKDEALDYVDGKVEGSKNLIKGAEEIWDGNFVDGMKDMVKGVDDLSPLPVSKTVRRAAKAVETVYDIAKK